MILNCIWKGLTTGLLVIAVLTLLPSGWVAWMLMVGGFCFIVIGIVANIAKRQPFALVMALCGVLLVFAANVVELVMLVIE